MGVKKGSAMASLGNELACEYDIRWYYNTAITTVFKRSVRLILRYRRCAYHR